MRIFLLHSTNHVQEFLLLLLRTVRKVETKNVGTGQEQLFDHLLVGGGRSQRGDLLGRFAPPLRDLRGGGHRGGEVGRLDGATEGGVFLLLLVRGGHEQRGLVDRAAAACGRRRRWNKSRGDRRQSGTSKEGGKLHGGRFVSKILESKPILQSLSMRLCGQIPSPPLFRNEDSKRRRHDIATISRTRSCFLTSALLIVDIERSRRGAVVKSTSALLLVSAFGFRSHDWRILIGQYYIRVLTRFLRS